MKKVLFFMLLLVIGLGAMAQQRIQLNSVDKAECVSSDMTSLRAYFSFSTIGAEDYQSDKGTFSWLSLPNTVIGGNEGDPQIPVINELIAVPVGATPRVEIKSYSFTDYSLADYDMKTLVPRQPSLRKDQHPGDVPFIMNEAAYQTSRELRSEPQAVVEVVGTMRGVRLGKLTIEPVSYDPINNTIRVFNDIEVTVSFDGANARATEDMLVETYSPYFNGIYDMLFNSSLIRSAYDDHSDLYYTPVKMLVVTTSAYVESTPFQNWLAWKKQKGFDVDVQTVTSSTSAANVRSLIQSRYNANHPTFLVIVGDETAVTNYTTYTVSGLNYNPYVSDLQYASIDNDVYHDMFMSRMSVSSTTELGYLVDKTLMYEQYTMPDPSYLSNVLLIAGADGTWAPKVGRPTINYAADNYFNTAHGFANVYKYVSDTYTGCYNYLSSGVGFANYTAHGDIQEWYSPNFTNSNVNSLTNTNKYFWAMGNCCLTCNFGNSSYSPCYGEAMIRAQNKGAFGYIGSVPESYWWEDYYFGVGATSVYSQTPSMSETTTGVYDFMFDDSQMNTLNSVPFAGNVAVTYAHAGSYSSSVSDEYYWRAYQCFGDGSVMPYHTQPVANNVSHASTIGIGMATFTVNADEGSYVAITKNNEILGVAQVPAGGSVNVPITGLNSAGDVMIVVTRQQRQPYTATIQAVSLDGPYISVDGYTPTAAHVGDNTALSITFKNVGADATTGNTTVTLTPGSSGITVDNGTGIFSSLAANATTTVSGFSFHVNQGVEDGAIVKIHYAAANGNDTWEGDINITAGEAVLEYQNMSWDGGFTPGQTLTLTAKFKNTGHYQATNAMASMSTTSNYITINNSPITVGTIAVGEEVSCQFNVTIAANCPETEVIPVTFTLMSDGGLSAQGDETLKNACNVYFNLSDSYGDGWNGASLVVSFSDGTPSETLTIGSGSSSATYPLEIGNGTHVTLTWTSGSYDGECSFTVSYEGDALIFSQTSRPSAGVLYEFDCNCGAASQTFTVTVASSNTEQGTVSGGGEFGFGQSCTVTATPTDGYMFTGWTMNGEIVSTAATYTFTVDSDMDLVANFAEGNMIGDGGETTNNFLPTYNYYNYSLTEQIYTPTELGDAGLITSIAFYNGGTEKTRTLDFYMKNTTKSSFSGNTDWVAVSASDKVFSGSVTFTADDWTVITFSTPFVYDGTSNVVLVTDDNTSGYTNSPHMACRVFDAASQALYVYSDGTNYSPSSPSSYTGTVLSEKNQLLITKEPISTEPVNITVSVSPAQAGTVIGGGEIAFGELCTVSVTPNEGYFFTGWTENGAVVSSDLEYSFSATSDRELVATFVQGIEIGEFTANNTYLPSYNYYNYSLTQQIYTADEIGEAGTISWIAFYNEGAEKTRTYDFYLKTTEKNSFSSNDDWITVAESDKVFTGDVTMAVGTWTIINFTTPFEYDGTSNLVLVVDDNSGAYTSSPHMTCSVFNTDEDQAIYIYNDNTDFDPMSPPAASTNNDVLSVKNHILMGLERPEPVVCGIVLDENNEWSENFDNLTTSTEKWTGTTMGTEGDCWTWTRLVELPDGYLDTVPQIYYNSNFAHESNYSLRLHFRGVYAMPVLDSMINLNDLKMGFYLRQSQTFYTLLVGVMTDPADPETFVPVAHIDNGTSTGVEYIELNFANYQGEGRYIAFKNVRPSATDFDGNWNDIHSVNYIDDIKLSLKEEGDCVVGLPYEIDFEEVTPSTNALTGAMPECWEMVQNDLDEEIPFDKMPQVYCKASLANNGNYSLRMVNRCIYAMPEFADTVDMSRIQLSMSVRQPNARYQLSVGVWSDGEFIPVALVNNTTTGYEDVVCDFSSYDGPAGRIAFRNMLAAGGNLDYSYNYIDDIVVSYMGAAPACDAVTSLNVTETFETFTQSTVAATGVKPTCWEVVDTDVEMGNDKYPQVYYNPNFGQGSYTLRMADRCVFAMPELEAGIELSDVTLTMTLRQPNTQYQLEVGVWEVGYDENQEPIEQFVPVATFHNSDNTVTEVSCDFSNYTGNGNRIAFHNTLKTANYNYSYNYIDDVTLTLTEAKIAESSNANVIDEMGVERYLEGIVVYPNPTLGELHIGAVDVQKVECYNQMGQLVAVYDNDRDINMSSLSQGVYTLRITVPQGVTMRKVVKR